MSEARMSENSQVDGRRYRAIALDVDGTLAGADHRVSQRSLGALRAAQEAGLVPIIITGRAEFAATSIAAHAALSAPVISCNGAVITDPRTRERLHVESMPTALVERTLTLSERFGFTAVLWSADQMFVAAPGAAADTLTEINGFSVTVTDLRTVPADTIVKAMVSAEPDTLDAHVREIASAVPELQRSMPIFYEASAPGSTKIEALRRVLSILHVDADECIGVGDSDADVEWMSAVGLPVAVQNARPAVQELAAVHIGHHAEDAVATFIHGVIDD